MYSQNCCKKLRMQYFQTNEHKNTFLPQNDNKSRRGFEKRFPKPKYTTNTLVRRNRLSAAFPEVQPSTARWRTMTMRLLFPSRPCKLASPPGAEDVEFTVCCLPFHRYCSRVRVCEDRWESFKKTVKNLDWYLNLFSVGSSL